jgi:hypothetical protein
MPWRGIHAPILRSNHILLCHCCCRRCRHTEKITRRHSLPRSFTVTLTILSGSPLTHHAHVASAAASSSWIQGRTTEG